MQLKQHPLSAAFPAMSADDFAALKDDIEVNGQREPVWLLDGMVLDGWHRYRACSELGLKAKQFTFPLDDDPVSYVKSANMHRRHMTASQRAIAEVALREWAPAGKPKAGAKAATVAALPKTTNEMAQEAKVSPRMIRDAKVVHKAGLSEPVKEGSLTVNEAAKIARGTEAKPEKKAQAKRAPWDKPAPPAEDFGPSDAEVAAAQRDQEEELASLRRIAESDDKLKAAMAEVKRFREENRILKERINSLMNEKLAAVQSANSWKRKAEKAEKATA